MYTRDYKHTSICHKKTPASCWDFFDTIYCITLESRQDRRNQAVREFTKVGLEDRVEFVTVAKNLDNPEQGIFESHMHCLHKGLGAGGRHILVFEDDVFFEDFNAKALLSACAYLKDQHGSWQGFFMGCLTGDSQKIHDQPLAKIQYRCLAHAYSLNHAFAKIITQEHWTGIPFDELLRRKQTAFYALYPMCAFQGRSGTDNHTKFLDLVRRFFGGLPFIQRVNQFYRHHTSFVIIFHLVIAMLLWLLVQNL